MNEPQDGVVPIGRTASGGVKEIEVTAKQIVDRISISGPSGGPGIGSLGNDGPGSLGKLLTGLETYQKQQHQSSTNNNNNAGGEKKNSIGVEDPNGGNSEANAETKRVPSLSRGTSRQLSIASIEGQASAEQKAVEQLLEAVQVCHSYQYYYLLLVWVELMLNLSFQKWVHEAQADCGSVEKNQNSEKELDNFHWVYSIESYLRSLDTDWTSQKTLTHKIASQLQNWLKQLFHFS